MIALAKGAAHYRQVLVMGDESLDHLVHPSLKNLFQRRADHPQLY